MSTPKILEIPGTTSARERVEVLISSQATRNSFCLIIQTSLPGGGPPIHKHEREDEAFCVLDGEFEFYENGQWMPFKKGEYKFSLRGNEHAFRNSGSTPSRILIVATPGGLDECFEAIAPLNLPQDFERLIEISQMYGIKLSI